MAFNVAPEGANQGQSFPPMDAKRHLAKTQILSRDSGTFPALLKTLSDPSEDVSSHDSKQEWCSLSGGQTRLAASCPDISIIRRLLLHELHEKRSRTFLDRSPTARDPRELDHSSIVSASQCRADLQDHCGDSGKGR